ncbi:MAG: hypothetical protein N2444_05775 [Methylocystis sp.]|nr:hypothetical protein [Methylocystis sp.]
MRRIRAADSAPGVRDWVKGCEYFLHGAHYEDRLHGAPGELIAQRDGDAASEKADEACDAWTVIRASHFFHVCNV